MAEVNAWQVDPNTRVQLQGTWGTKKKIVLNGVELAREALKADAPVSVSLPDGRKAIFTMSPTIGLRPDIELRVGGEVVLSELEREQMACLACGMAAKPDAQFCERCGSPIHQGAVQRKIVRFRSARKAIGWVAALYLFSGAVMFFVQDLAAQKSLKELAGYEATDVRSGQEAGEQVTVGELRDEITQGPWWVLALNLFLSIVMLGLYLYAKHSPLVAMVTALAVFLSVHVLNAIADPKTIGQGLWVKIIVTVMLVNGIQAALQLRKVGA